MRFCQQRGSVDEQRDDDGSRLQRVQSPLVAIHEMQAAGGALQSSEVDQAEALTEDPSFLQRSSSGATPASPTSLGPTPVVRSFSMHGLSESGQSTALSATAAARKLTTSRSLSIVKRNLQRDAKCQSPGQQAARAASGDCEFDSRWAYSELPFSAS